MNNLKCSNCKREGLVENDFSIDKRSSSGRRYECKQCQRERGKKYSKEYYEAHKEEVLKKAKARYRKKVKGKKIFLDAN